MSNIRVRRTMGSEKWWSTSRRKDIPLIGSLVRRLMQVMGLEPMYPKPHLSRAGEPSVRYPYVLRGVVVDRIDQVWSCDITYIRLTRGFVYLMAIIDWFSRYVLAWELSTTLDTSFCVEALDRALRGATPEIFNTDQ